MSANASLSLVSGDTGQAVRAVRQIVIWSETTDNFCTGPGQSTEDVKWLDEKLRAFFEK